MTDTRGKERTKTVYMHGGLHWALKVACAAERTTMVDVLSDAAEAWSANGHAVPEALPALESGRKREANCYLRAQAHQELKTACARRRTTMAHMVNAFAAEWLQKAGHEKILTTALEVDTT